MMPTILLFDVDGTLVTTAGAGRRAIERAFRVRYDRLDACSQFRMDGMTDRAIIRAGLLFIGQPATEEAIDDLLPIYVSELEDEVARADPSRYRAHPGIEEALEMARKQSDFAIGLGTGNIREGARVKLNRVNLYRYFAFGGFGCDYEDRAELIRCGARRGAERHGRPLSDCRVVVIGDTPKDIAAATAIGAESIGVGTGSFTAEQLLEAGATAAFSNLQQREALEHLLG
jgi:phosphoglycolate phosphatase-like HAD superfamily hydrolase